MTRVVPRSELPPAQPTADEARLTVGMRLGRYELLCPIAEGGMAQVWAAEQTGDLGFRKLIALKTIRPDFAYDASFRAMFLDEAQLASRIRHVNVVEVLDLGVEGDIVFQAMALVDGVACSAWMRTVKEGLPRGVAVRIAIDILHGLHAAHTLKDDEGHLLGLVHRDVSPQNVLVGSDGVAKLADFGIAKAFGRATEETVAGDVKGKLGYVAPEQLRGIPAGPQSDLYSASVVLWELLTAQRLFPVMNDSTESTAKRRRMTARDPRSAVPSLPKSICGIVMRALSENPLDRYQTSLEMADALEEAARREDIVISHRAVASALEKDLGRRLEAMRERLRQAKKRAGLTPAPTPTPRSRRATGPISQPLPSAPMRASYTGHAGPPEPMDAQYTEILPLALATPVTRVSERQDFATDTVTIAETPQPAFAPRPKRKPASGALLPLVAVIMLLAALVVGVGIWVPAKHRTAAPQPPPIVTALPTTEPAPEPASTAAPPTALEPAPTAAPPPEPAPTPIASAPPAPPHRPPTPHGRTRPAPKPTPAPATTPTIAPRFENPY